MKSGDNQNSFVKEKTIKISTHGQLRHRIGELICPRGIRVNLYYWPSQLKVNSYYWDGYEEKESTKTIAAYYITWDVLVCSTKHTTSTTKTAVNGIIIYKMYINSPYFPRSICILHGANKRFK